MTVIKTDMIFIQKLQNIVSMPRPINSPISMVDSCDENIDWMVAPTLSAVEPVIALAASFTI